MTTVEKVARAIAGSFGDVETVWNHEHVECLNAARAAIAAMREPTREMREAGDRAGGKAYEWTGDSTVHHARNSWPAMIDAALAEDAG